MHPQNEQHYCAVPPCSHNNHLNEAEFYIVQKIKDIMEQLARKIEVYSMG